MILAINRELEVLFFISFSMPKKREMPFSSFWFFVHITTTPGTTMLLKNIQFWLEERGKMSVHNYIEISIFYEKSPLTLIHRLGLVCVYIKRALESFVYG